MPRSRPASNPISYHKYTNQYYVTRGGKRIYLGCDKEEALKKYYHLGLGFDFAPEPETKIVNITIKDLANRFITAQQANWQNPDLTMKSYKQWLGRFLKDPPKLRLRKTSSLKTVTKNHELKTDYLINRFFNRLMASSASRE